MFPHPSSVFLHYSILSVHHTYLANLPLPFKRTLIEHHSASHSLPEAKTWGGMQQLISNTPSPPSDMTGNTAFGRFSSAQTADPPTRILSEFSLQLEFVLSTSGLLYRFMEERKDSLDNSINLLPPSSPSPFLPWKGESRSSLPCFPLL